MLQVPALQLLQVSRAPPADSVYNGCFCFAALPAAVQLACSTTCAMRTEPRNDLKLIKLIILRKVGSSSSASKQVYITGNPKS